MDMSGAAPNTAWFEIRDEAGELLESIPARSSGAAISAVLPAFPAGTRGTIQLCTTTDGVVHRREAELEELPTAPVVKLIQMG